MARHISISEDTIRTDIGTSDSNRIRTSEDRCQESGLTMAKLYERFQHFEFRIAVLLVNISSGNYYIPPLLLCLRF